jgi:hypothetical protein
MTSLKGRSYPSSFSLLVEQSQLANHLTQMPVQTTLQYVLTINILGYVSIIRATATRHCFESPMLTSHTVIYICSNYWISQYGARKRPTVVFHINGYDFYLHLFDTFLKLHQSVSQAMCVCQNGTSEIAEN